MRNTNAIEVFSGVNPDDRGTMPMEAWSAALDLLMAFSVSCTTASRQQFS